MTGALSYASPANWISLHARHAPHRRCFVAADGTVHTFGAVNARVNRLARALSAAGLRRGDRIGILATDCVDYMALLMASLKLGTVYVPYNYRLSAAETLGVVKAALLEAFVTTARYAAVVPEVQQMCTGLRLLASFGDGVEGATSIDDLVAGVGDDSDLEVATQPEDVISLMFTSGTTGLPKGVLQSARMLTNAATAAMIDLRLQPDDFRYSPSPMFHIAGLGYLFYGVARGLCSLVMEQYDPGELLRWIAAPDGLTGMVIMPTMLRDLLRLPGVETGAYPRFTDIIYGGAPMQPEQLREAMEVFPGARFYNSFGAGTEAVGQTVLSPEDHQRALAGRTELLGSIGKPSWGVELRIVDPDRNDLPRGEVGEILTRSGTVMSGYLGDPLRTAEAVSDGWFRAGDLAWQDDDGYVFLAGRKNDMIIRGGENIHPAEVERVLMSHPSVVGAGVLGLPDDRWGEVVVAAVETADGSPADEEELRRFCRASLAAYKVPVRIDTVDELPRNANGKVQKFVLARRFSQRRFS